MRLRTLLLHSALLFTGAWTKEDEPATEVTEFNFVPYNVNYFDDSDVLLFEDPFGRNVYRSDDAGVSWDVVDSVPKGQLLEFTMHPFDNKRAFIITEEKTHYQTKDRGKTWTSFYADYPASAFREALTFHAGDPNRIIFNAMDCTGPFCDGATMYTTNSFETDAKFLRADTEGCYWAKSSELFSTGQKDLNDDRILCVVKGRFSPWRKDFRLLISDDFFRELSGTIQEFEPELEPGRTVQGIVNLAIVKAYLVVAASAEGTDEMALYVTDDTVRWHRAIFPHDHKLTEQAYTILEGTNYSIQIDVMNARPSNPMGVMLSSNSNGTYFTRNIEHTNRNIWGLVDFEKVSGIQGIVLVNVVENWEDVEDSGTSKKIVSKISFDDGRTWEGLKYEKDDLHLHSVTDLDNSGRVFSSPAPGIVMGVGNVGKYLGDLEDGNLYVSDDAGLTWRLALVGPHKYEFGDQGSVLVAVKDGFGDEVRFSLNHGKDWGKVDLKQKVRPVQLTTTKDSTSLKFLLEAVDDERPSVNGFIVALDFDNMHERQCKDSDMEDWWARVDEDGKPTCIMGHKQKYRRRKADADCFIKDEFRDPVPEFTPCECTDEDYECDYNFVRSEDRTECIRPPGVSLVLPEGACKAFGPDDTFMGSSGWRHIPDNACVDGKKKDKLVEHKCVDAVGSPLSGKVDHVAETFRGQRFRNKVYLERTGISTGNDETVLVRTDEGVFISSDHGKTFNQILKDENIVAIYPHRYFNDMVFFLTLTKKVFYSTERGLNIRSFEAPTPPNDDGLTVMNFHPKNKDWIIWIGARDCDSAAGCHSEASITLDRGDDRWRTLQRYVNRCEFVQEFDARYLPSQKEEQEARDKLIYCEVREQEHSDPTDNPLLLVSSDNFFAEPPTQHFRDVIDFASMAEFVVVATKDEELETLHVETSVDGISFAAAQFPHGLDIPHQRGYTVLDSSTHAVFLHVSVEVDTGFEYGTIIKSNSNGTSYVLSLNGVDRDTSGYVDFEKALGVEGVAMVNVVANYDSKNFRKEGKTLKTMITHNDGAEWDYLKPPAKNPDGKKYDCGSNIEKCALHLHGYTEREEKSRTYSSPSAIGLMFGTGNVGESLSTKKEADTFMTTDGGINWKVVKKGSYLWEFGDQGSILVIVKSTEATKEVHFSLDEGDTWEPYQISDHEIEIDDLTTSPSDNSRSFLLWGKDKGELVTINLDFSGLTDEQCKLDEEDVEGGDYYLWTPKHPKQDDDCLFGHVSQYHRKRTSSNCYNGRMIPHLHDIAKNCECTRRDFECDYNYERQSDGSCSLVSGLAPADHQLNCRLDENAVEYYEPTGYRRIVMTTCQGGREMDVSIPHPCDGKQDEFNKKHKTSGIAIFFAIIIPFALAGGIGYWVWKNWANKFGQIRLGEQSSFDGEAPYIKYPVLVLAGIVAVAQALPLLIASLWRSASSLMGRGGSRRFTTRDSFARGRGDYDIVDEDEGELLGDESDEEV